MEQLKLEIINQFGIEKGSIMLMRAIPNIMADFKKTIEKSMVGLEVYDEYRFDDGSGAIVLYGYKNSNGVCTLAKAVINGKTVTCNYTL